MRRVLLEEAAVELHEIRLPYIAEYITAFRALESRITLKQRRMLELHHAAPSRVMSATRLAEDAGFPNFKAANLQYGLLAGEVCKQLAVSLDPELGILVTFVRPETASNEHWLWIMRPNVAQALEDLGWVPRVSHLLYPEVALEIMSNEG